MNPGEGRTRARLPESQRAGLQKPNREPRWGPELTVTSPASQPANPGLSVGIRKGLQKRPSLTCGEKKTILPPVDSTHSRGEAKLGARASCQCALLSYPCSRALVAFRRTRVAAGVSQKHPPGSLDDQGEFGLPLPQNGVRIGSRFLCPLPIPGAFFL